MTEVSGPIIAIALVTLALYSCRWPFLTGVTGTFYQTVCVTIAISTGSRDQFAHPVARPRGELLKSHDAPEDMLYSAVGRAFGRVVRRRSTTQPLLQASSDRYSGSVSGAF